MNNIATHKTPAWGHKSNFIIRADLAEFELPGRFEQLWARKVKSTTFEICCIPFFTYGIALGDIVKTNSDFTIQNVSKKLGHRTLRIACARKENEGNIHVALHKWIDSTDLLYEWHTHGYLAVDIPPSEKADLSFPVIEQLSEQGDISYEID